MKLWVQFAQIGWDSGDEDFHCGIGRADLKTGLVCQHGQNWGEEENITVRLPSKFDFFLLPETLQVCQINSHTHPQKGPGSAGSQQLCSPRRQQLPLNKNT